MAFQKPRSRLEFTREGKYFVALTLGIGFAAINTGNNLLHLVLGMMLAFIIGSGVLSEIALRGLDVQRRVPDRVYAGRPFLMGINVFNTKRRFPSFSVEVEDLHLSESLRKKCYFLKVPAGRTQHTSYRLTFERRGRHRFTGFRVGTRFPFGLFHKTRIAARPDEMVVYPAIFSLQIPSGRSGPEGHGNRGRLDRQGEFYALREHVDGDDPRDIHWRKSARVGRLLTRQNEENTGRRVAIFFDNHQRHGSPDPREVAEQERAVSRAASLAAHYTRRGYVVRLATRTVGVGPGSGQAHLGQILRALALIEFTTEQLPYVAPARWTGECIFVSPGGPASPGDRTAA